jgi:hypothetical protein
MPAPALVRIHGDPEGPTPGASNASMLASLPAEAIQKLLEVAGPDSGSALLATELRQLGGQIGRPHEGAGVLPQLDGQFILFGVGLVLSPEMGAKVEADAARLMEALSPWSNGRQYLNFAESEVDTSTGYRAGNYARLQAIRSAADPDGLFVANHRVSSTAPAGAVPEPR